MPQVSLYIEKLLYKEVESKAKEKGQSLSGFVSDVLKENLKDSWPEGYFEKYVGIFKDDPLEEPEELPWSLDAKREEF